jgi:general secretion pathway protein J
MPPSSNNPHQGFTLIEVLIAMTLMSVMLAVLFGSMKICAESWEKGENKIADVNETAVVYQFFQQHLTTTIPLWDDFSNEEKMLSFQGTKESLQFVSGFPASAKKSGLQLFKIKYLNDKEGGYIEVAIKPFFPSQEKDKEEDSGDSVNLISGVTNLTVSYYGIDESQPEGYWQDEWTNRENLPKLVKIKIERDSGSPWPDMIFDIKAFGTMPGSDSSAMTDEDRAAAEAAALESQ